MEQKIAMDSANSIDPLEDSQCASLSTKSFAPRKTFGLGAILLTAAASLSSCTKFADVSGPSEEDFGRTVNSVSSVVSGIVAQKAYGDGSFNFTVTKPGWYDSKVTGDVTPQSIKTSMDLDLTSNVFNASGVPGRMKGSVDKSEFDWEVAQVSDSTWHIGRWGFKFDNTLTLNVNAGKVSGTLERPMGFNWHVNGTYNQEGNVTLTIETGALDPNFTISGQVVQR